VNGKRGGTHLLPSARSNATLFAKGKTWFWPKIAFALVSKHHWLVTACEAFRVRRHNLTFDKLRDLKV
jgi:hypothetical protein